MEKMKDEGAGSAKLQVAKSGVESGAYAPKGNLTLTEAQKKALQAMAEAVDSLVGDSGGAHTESQEQALQVLRRWASGAL